MSEKVWHLKLTEVVFHGVHAHQKNVEGVDVKVWTKKER